MLGFFIIGTVQLAKAADVPFVVEDIHPVIHGISRRDQVA
jgi:hypothetical protein